MSKSRPHLKTLEGIERECIPDLVEVLRTEGIEGVRYAVWNLTAVFVKVEPVFEGGWRRAL